MIQSCKNRSSRQFWQNVEMHSRRNGYPGRQRVSFLSACWETREFLIAVVRFPIVHAWTKSTCRMCSALREKFTSIRQTFSYFRRINRLVTSGLWLLGKLQKVRNVLSSTRWKKKQQTDELIKVGLIQDHTAQCCNWSTSFRYTNCSGIINTLKAQ